MKIIGIDFTSSPSRRKPITALRCNLEEGTLTAGELETWPDFNHFEKMLATPGPWIAGIDFPFGQARRFIDTIGWPKNWADYVRHAQSLQRDGFRKTLDRYRAKRADGDKEHRRATDSAAGSISPQKLFGVPVGLMFFEGAPRLLKSGVTIPRVLRGDPDRIAVEAYPGVIARRLIGRRSYKNDTKSKQTPDQYRARQELFQKLIAGSQELYGLTIKADPSLCDDPGGDTLDALLCAVQAAWAWSQRETGYGAPQDPDELEGWIADPLLCGGTPKSERKEERDDDLVVVTLKIRRSTYEAARTIAAGSNSELPGEFRGTMKAEDSLGQVLDTHLGDYAQHFEAGFEGFNGKGGMMKIAERAGLVADSDTDEVQPLWAVRFAGQGLDGPGISATYQAGNITYLALTPLNIEPVTRTLGGKTYNAIDMDAWSRSTFAAIDKLFEPDLSAAIALLEGDGAQKTSVSESLTKSKKAIADAVPKTLETVLQTSPAGDRTKAKKQLEQAMLNRLSEAYTVSTVMQVPATVTARNSTGPVFEGGALPPELFGRIGAPLIGAPQLDSGTANKSKVYDLSSGRLDVADGEQWSTVLVTVTDQQEYSSLSLDLEHDISGLQHELEKSEEFEGYTPSSWMKPVIPGDDVLTVPITAGTPAVIPIPLPFEPPAPTLKSQTALGSPFDWKPGDGLSQLIKDALKWTYNTGLKTPLAAQDQLYFDAIFGIGDVPRHNGGGTATKPINENLYSAMAGFLDAWPAFDAKIPSLIATATSQTTTTAEREAALADVKALAGLVAKVSDAWSPPPTAEGRFAPQVPEVIHYRLQFERIGASKDIKITLGGWTKGPDGTGVIPTRWPTISFTPQTGDNSISPWKPVPDNPTPVLDGNVKWWPIETTVEADEFPQDFDLSWEDLDLSERQLGRLETWTRRNARLVKGKDTNPDFVYETSVVSFASPGLPLIERTDIPRVKPDAGSTLETILTALLQPLMFGEQTLEPFIRFQANLRYTLVAPKSDSANALDAVIPLVLQPNLVLKVSGVVTPTTAAHGLTTVISANVAKFAGRGGNVYLDLSLTLFGSEAGQQVPLVMIDPLTLDVTAVPPDWWLPKQPS